MVFQVWIPRRPRTETRDWHPLPPQQAGPLCLRFPTFPRGCAVQPVCCRGESALPCFHRPRPASGSRWNPSEFGLYKCDLYIFFVHFSHLPWPKASTSINQSSGGVTTPLSFPPPSSSIPHTLPAHAAWLEAPQPFLHKLTDPAWIPLISKG